MESGEDTRNSSTDANPRAQNTRVLRQSSAQKPPMLQIRTQPFTLASATGHSVAPPLPDHQKMHKASQARRAAVDRGASALEGRTHRARGRRK